MSVKRQVYERIRDTIKKITNDKVYVHTLPGGRKILMIKKYKYCPVVDIIKDAKNPNAHNITISFGNIKKVRFKWYDNLNRFTTGYTYEIERAIKYVRDKLKQFDTYVSFDIGAKNIIEAIVYNRNKTDENMLELFATENYLVQAAARRVIFSIHNKLAKAIQEDNQEEIDNQIRNLFGFIEKTIKEYFYPEIKKHLYYLKKYVIDNIDNLEKTLFIIPMQKYVDYPIPNDSKLFRMIKRRTYDDSMDSLDVMDAFVFGRVIYLGILMLTSLLENRGARYFFIDEYDTSNNLFETYPVTRVGYKEHILNLNGIDMNVEKNNISCLNHIYYVNPEIKDKILVEYNNKTYLVRYTKKTFIPFINMLIDEDRKEIDVDVNLDLFNAATWIKLYKMYKEKTS